MGLALQKSTDGGTTFQQVSLSVADYTLPESTTVANIFYSVKDSKNNTFIFCGTSSGDQKGKLIKVSSNGIITSATLNWSSVSYIPSNFLPQMTISRDENSIIMLICETVSVRRLVALPLNFTDGQVISMPTPLIADALPVNAKFAIYQDRYIWVASGTTVKIYDYTTKAELASATIGGSPYAIALSQNNELFIISDNVTKIFKLSFNGVSAITITEVVASLSISTQSKQLLIDRFGDLIILTNTGTASTLLKFNASGILIDNINLSTASILGEGKGGYGLQVYSHKDKTTGAVVDCYCYFGNELVSCRTAPTTAQGQPFGAITKIRKNGETTYGDDWGGDNNYSVRC